MNERTHGWLVVGLSAIFFVLDGLIFLGIEPSRSIVFWINSISMVAVVVGLHFLWRTGIFQRSPLSRLGSFGVGLAILSYLFRIMHWPFAKEGIVLAFAINLVVYGVHFFLKGRRSIGDILRLLVMVVTCTLFPLAFLHIVPSVQAYWAVIGIIAIAVLEYQLNQKPRPSPQGPNPKRPDFSGNSTTKPNSAEEEELKMRFPELFNED